MGDANNDWIVTVDLINEAKVEPPAELAKVTEQWEAIYQGTDGKPGLWEVETLLMDPSLLRKLSSKYPTAIVTGRPRLDAERFLKQVNQRPEPGQQDCLLGSMRRVVAVAIGVRSCLSNRTCGVLLLLQHGIEDCVKFLVCMGEAKSKPDPEGVQLALKTLGVERALFVGDTPDDVVAGNASGTGGQRDLDDGAPFACWVRRCQQPNALGEVGMSLCHHLLVLC